MVIYDRLCCLHFEFITIFGNVYTIIVFASIHSTKSNKLSLFYFYRHIIAENMNIST